MSVNVTFTVPTQACALGRSIGDDPETRIEIDRIVPTDDTVMPFFWVLNGESDAFASSAEREPAIDHITIVDRVENGALLSARWNHEAAGTFRGIVQNDGTLLDARANTVEWEFSVRFADGDRAASFTQFCRENEIPISLTRVSGSANRRGDSLGDMTPEQREAMAVAYRTGYFDEPRRITLDELAARFDISPRAVAGRLRRGQARLIEATGLADSTQTDPAK
ncbi:bacterio-opsin activator [Haloprofundus marisrubri]|uniref:Bacterio-opsin activator n=1 Tax=Haloprofundus marisrubri TaxID=1514971 RepID=A0A0W1R883_9EURY|nr:helix-turn-helix domain-containing protein [Haloprofundus marisrubri]KTG09436.1 bacterio-opsin activator [Haloprofundus marisrubri]